MSKVDLPLVLHKAILGPDHGYDACHFQKRVITACKFGSRDGKIRSLKAFRSLKASRRSYHAAYMLYQRYRDAALARWPCPIAQPLTAGNYIAELVDFAKKKATSLSLILASAGITPLDGILLAPAFEAMSRVHRPGRNQHPSSPNSFASASVSWRS
jgi:hypothetical protein